jgi:DNA-binding LytR/AlgR family response regulator
MFQKLPDYLNEKSNIIRLIVLTALFALVFINIYEPFNSRSWKPGISEMAYFLYSSLITLTGVLVVVISRIIMYYHCKHGKTLLIWHYAVWVLAEITVMSSFYALFEILVMHDQRSVNALMKGSITNTSLILLLPYAILWLYFSYLDKKKKLELIESGENEPTKKSMLSFSDEKSDLKLSIQTEQLLYLESADNYVKIYYLNKGKLTNFMLRNSLKNIEESLSGTALIRCHRSFVVNFDKVKVLRKEKDGIYLALDQENIPDIPVSKTYTERVMAKFSLYSV